MVLTDWQTTINHLNSKKKMADRLTGLSKHIWIYEIMPDRLTDKNKAPDFQKKSWLTDRESYENIYGFFKLCLTVWQTKIKPPISKKKVGWQTDRAIVAHMSF